MHVRVPVCEHVHLCIHVCVCVDMYRAIEAGGCGGNEVLDNKMLEMSDAS